MASYIEDAHGLSEREADAVARELIATRPQLPRGMMQALRDARAKEANPKARREQREADKEQKLQAAAGNAVQAEMDQKKEHKARCLHKNDWWIHIKLSNHMSVAGLREAIALQLNKGGYGHPYDDYTTASDMVEVVTGSADAALSTNYLLVSDGAACKALREGSFSIVTAHPACSQPGCLRYLPLRMSASHCDACLETRLPPWKSMDSCAQETRKWKATLQSDCCSEHLCLHVSRGGLNGSTIAFTSTNRASGMLQYYEHAPHRAQVMPDEVCSMDIEPMPARVQTGRKLMQELRFTALRLLQHQQRFFPNQSLIREWDIERFNEAEAMCHSALADVAVWLNEDTSNDVQLTPTLGQGSSPHHRVKEISKLLDDAYRRVATSIDVPAGDTCWNQAIEGRRRR